MRRSHHALKRINVVEDKTTGEFKLPHQLTADGVYNGRNVLVSVAEPQAAAS